MQDHLEMAQLTGDFPKIIQVCRLQLKAVKPVVFSLHWILTRNVVILDIALQLLRDSDEIVLLMVEMSSTY